MVNKYVTNSSRMENVMLVKVVNPDTLEIAGIVCKMMKDANMKNHVDICIDRGKESTKIPKKGYQKMLTL